MKDKTFIGKYEIEICVQAPNMHEAYPKIESIADKVFDVKEVLQVTQTSIELKR